MVDVEGRRIWQQAAGDDDRDYAELCLKWDVILNGPGDYGRWPQCANHLREDEYSERKITDLRRFCEEMENGDLVILRRGTSVALAVGEIVGCYEHHEEFNDVDGWDVSHVRRVRWLWKGSKQFDTYTLRLGDTTQRLNSEVVNSWLESLNVSDDAYVHDPVQLPCVRVNADISVDEISDYLFGKGVASAVISSLLVEIGELIRIANWYKREQKPSERETVIYLVVPLLRALGWTPQRMAIEWNKMDVALFSSLPRKHDVVSVIVEAKKMDSSCLSAVSQAADYALGAEHCTRLIVTDGLRYGVFAREGVESSLNGKFSLNAYVNLRRLRSEYPLYDCRGAQDALLAMSPEWQ
jgi:hypothetical protein